MKKTLNNNEKNSVEVFCPENWCGRKTPYKLPGYLTNHLWNNHIDKYPTKEVAAAQTSLLFAQEAARSLEGLSPTIHSGPELEEGEILEEEEIFEEVIDEGQVVQRASPSLTRSLAPTSNYPAPQARQDFQSQS